MAFSRFQSECGMVPNEVTIYYVCKTYMYVETILRRIILYKKEVLSIADNTRRRRRISAHLHRALAPALPAWKLQINKQTRDSQTRTDVPKVANTASCYF